jgi:hypothetical protein
MRNIILYVVFYYKIVELSNDEMKRQPFLPRTLFKLGIERRLVLLGDAISKCVCSVSFFFPPEFREPPLV